jgi:predicted hydrocarbon binding protein
VAALEIRNRSMPDPVAELPIVDAYMRWALLAAEEVIGRPGLSAILRQINLAPIIDNYPPELLQVSGNYKYADYANLNCGLLEFFGRAGKSMTMRVGRISARHGIEQQSEIFGIAVLIASKILPLPTQIRKGLESMQNGYRRLMPNVRLRLEDRGDKIVYLTETCSLCAGKEANGHICWTFSGVLQGLLSWQTGKDLEIDEVQCRAQGAPTCVWEISKKPKE